MTIAIHDSLTGFHLFHRASQARRSRVIERLVRTISLWRGRIRDRNAFAKFGERDLQDLGISRWQVDLEVNKPFWRG